MLRLVHGLVDETEICGRRVRLAGNVVRGGSVRGRCRESNHEVAHREVRLESAAGSDPHDLLNAERRELLDHDRCGGASHPTRLDRDGLTVEGSREPEHAPLAVSLYDVLEEGLGYVLGAERVAREKAGFGVIAGVGTYVNWHCRSLDG